MNDAPRPTRLFALTVKHAARPTSSFVTVKLVPVPALSCAVVYAAPGGAACVHSVDDVADADAHGAPFAAIEHATSPMGGVRTDTV